MSCVTCSSSLSLAGRWRSLSLPPRFVAVVYEPTSSPMPDESMVVTPERSSRILVLPALTALVITSRSCVSPEPILIFPCRLMISTPSTVWEVAFICNFSFCESGVRACDAAAFGQVFRHDQRRSAAGLKRVADLVHEGLHVKDPAAARLHEVLRIERVAHFLGVETLTFIRDRDLQLESLKLEGGVHLLVNIEFIAVFDGIGNRFADCHADPVRPILVDTCVLAEVLRDHLNQFDVLEAATDRDLDSLGVAALHGLNCRAF